MADVTTASLEQQEKMGRRRFDTGIEFEKTISSLSRSIQDRLISDLPSNYPQDRNTNLAELYRAVAEEFARLQMSLSDVNDDQYHDTTRYQYLYEILGDTLFLDQNAINYNISDEAYRQFLITIRNAYFGGSRTANIESAVSDILGVPVTLKELYLEARKTNSSYTIKDTNKMFFDVLMDYVSSASSIGLILQNLKFFLDLIKPGHVLYDTRLVWTDTFVNTKGSCTPNYATGASLPDIVYGVDKIDLVTSVVDRLYYFPEDIYETGANERWTVASVSYTDIYKGIIYAQETGIQGVTGPNVILVVGENSQLYERTEVTGLSAGESEVTDTSITISGVTGLVKYYAAQDGPTTSGVITPDWLYTGIIDSLDFSNETITLDSGKTIVYNSDVLVYTRDQNGEYRIFVTGLNAGQSIAFKGTAYSEFFNFYNVPEEVKGMTYKQFDPEVINRPFFQENVKKVPETRDGLPLGPAVVMVDGVATAVDIESKFYQRANAVNYKNTDVYRYSLYINNVYTNQLPPIYAPDPEITVDEAKALFETGPYWYTGLENSSYRIDVNTTAQLVGTTGASTVQAINDQTEFCDRRAECHLMPYYEDNRKYYEYPDLVITSGFIPTTSIPAPVSPTGVYDLPSYFAISSDPNTYQMPLLPILNVTGAPAAASDLVVYVNGLKIDDAVSNVDPWAGEVALNFLPPANSLIRIDYYYSGRYPQAQYYIERIGEVQTSQRLQWPYPIAVTGMYGGAQDFQVDLYPILNQQGELASPADIGTYVGGLGATGIIVGATGTNSPTGIYILFSDSVITGITGGDTLVVNSQDIFDNTLIYSIKGITGNEIATDRPFPLDISTTGYNPTFEIIKFTGPSGVVDQVRPLLGHIHTTYTGAVGSYIKFDYYFTNFNRTYPIVPDVWGETSLYWDQGYTPDTFYGNNSGFTLVPDQGYIVQGATGAPGITGQVAPIFAFNQVAKTGYRYRAFNLSNSSVLDSRDTLITDGYTKGDGRASWKNNHGVLDQYNLLFSPEYLTDTNKSIAFNDKYLQNGLDPVTKLYPGTPLFVQTYSDDGHYKDDILPQGQDTYQEPSQSSYDLKAGFTIVGTDTSGLIDYQPVCEFEKNKRIRLYSGLRMVETDFPGFQGPLTSITEGQRSIPFKMLYIDQYYPNREQRLNDYLDYINRVPEDMKSGILKTLKNSKIVKRVEGNWLSLRTGDMLTIKDVPFGETGINIVYTVLDVIDYETVELTTTFKQVSGEYTYDLARDTVYNVDVYLNEVTRAISITGLNTLENLGASGLNGLPIFVYGETGIANEICFPDPGLNPYPRSPDNTNIPALPSTPNRDRTLVFTHETGLGPTDSKYIPLISDIIGADGNPVLYTGMYPGYTGSYTGPSGAINIGLTGPGGETGSNNSRIVEGDDKYFIPSGSTGVFWAYSESEYRVNWRNWDQGVMIVHVTNLALPTGIPGGISGMTGANWIQGITGRIDWGIKLV